MRRRESNGLLPSAREPRRVVFLATPSSSGVDLKLVALKKRFDPTNVLSSNQNIAG